MTSRESYIKQRNNQKYDLQWFYKYWNDNGGKQIDINTFGQIFNMQDLNSILNFLDHKFKLNILCNKDGSFVKAFE